MSYVDKCEKLFLEHEKLKKEASIMKNILLSLYKAGIDAEILIKWYEQEMQAKMFLD